jgi:hypothetical protein
MKPLCEVCSTRHELWQGHVFATNADRKKAFVGLIATNAPVKAAESATSAAIPATNDATNEPLVMRTLNRRDRVDYNAYQREYMKVYRAVKSGRAEWIR